MKKFSDIWNSFLESYISVVIIGTGTLSCVMTVYNLTITPLIGFVVLMFLAFCITCIFMVVDNTDTPNKEILDEKNKKVNIRNVRIRNRALLTCCGLSIWTSFLIIPQMDLGNIIRYNNGERIIKFLIFNPFEDNLTICRYKYPVYSLGLHGQTEDGFEVKTVIYPHFYLVGPDRLPLEMQNSKIISSEIKRVLSHEFSVICNEKTLGEIESRFSDFSVTFASRVRRSLHPRGLSFGDELILKEIQAYNKINI